MIASLSGKVAERRADHVVIECGGVGFRVAVSSQTLAKVPGKGHEGTLRTHMILRDDGAHLYGFASDEERELFLQLISVAGVAPRWPSPCCRARRSADTRRAIAAGDVKRFQVVPGHRPQDRRARDRRAAGADRRRARRRRRAPPPATSARARWRARVSSASATTPPRRSRCSTRRERSAGARRRGRGSDRGCAAHGGEGRMTSPAGEISVQVPAVRAGEEELDRSLRPQRLEEFVGQEQLKRQLALFMEAARRRGEPLDHVLLAGPPGLGKTSLAQIVARELGVPVRADRGPGPRAQGRRGRVPDRARARLRVLHRRDPPAHARGRGDPLSGDGGPQASDRARAGRRRADRDARPARLHARRRDHAHGAADDSAAGALRRLPSAGALSDRRSGADRPALRPHPGSRHRRRRRGGDRDAGARHPARREPAAEARAGLRRGSRSRRDHASPWRSRPWRCWRSTPPAWTGSTGSSCARSWRSSTAARSGLSTLAVSVGEEPDTIEDVYEPYLLQRGLIKRTPRGRVATSSAYEHLGLEPPEGDSRGASLF